MDLYLLLARFARSAPAQLTFTGSSQVWEGACAETRKKFEQMLLNQPVRSPTFKRAQETLRDRDWIKRSVPHHWALKSSQSDFSQQRLSNDEIEIRALVRVQAVIVQDCHAASRAPGTTARSNSASSIFRKVLILEVTPCNFNRS